jgi:hypothetical protein
MIMGDSFDVFSRDVSAWSFGASLKAGVIKWERLMI